MKRLIVKGLRALGVVALMVVLGVLLAVYLLVDGLVHGVLALNACACGIIEDAIESWRELSA